MKRKLKARITKAIVQVEKASESPRAYGFLPDIKECLKAMLAGLATMTPKERDRLAGGLGYLVSDNFAFAESSLGTTLLEVADEFASTEKRR
jgi:hypothetical protein